MNTENQLVLNLPERHCGKCYKCRVMEMARTVILSWAGQGAPVGDCVSTWNGLLQNNPCDNKSEDEPMATDWKMQSHVAQHTNTLVSVVDRLECKDFTKMMGSGILVSLTDLEGKPITERFMVPGEDMERIKVELIRSIRAHLVLRRAMLINDLSNIDRLLNTGQEQANAANKNV